MNWTEILIKVAVEDTEKTSAIANMTVPYGIYVEDYSDLIEQSWEIAHVDIIEQELLDRDRKTSIIHIYISEEDNASEAILYLEERLNASGIKFELCNNSVNDSEWENGWKKYFKCTKIGERLIIRPSWEELNDSEGRKVLTIDPGAAFGTGTHATTTLCLEMLEKYVQPDDLMLDVGCGSGILSIAAVLLGAKKAIGVDIDAQSVKVAKENAALNEMTSKTEYLIGDLAEKVEGKYSVVCANIVADVIIRLLETIKNYMTDDAVLITSGIIDSRENDLLEAFKKFGFKIVEQRYKDNWCAFAVKKEEN